MIPAAVLSETIAAAAVIIGCCALGGAAARRAGQPEIVGQLLAGIALGPSVLGHLPGHLYRHLFPVEALGFINVTAQLVLVLFLFAVGYELDLRKVRGHTAVVPLVALGAFALPMALGAAATELAGPLLSDHAGTGGSHGAFVLFMAVAMSITAVPVLAGILRERAMTDQLAGVVAMAAAGLIDAAGWLSLSAVLVVSDGSASARRPLPVTVALLLVYLAVMLAVVRPALRWWMRRENALARYRTPLIAVVALASAWATSALGLQVIFGAFVAGLITPRGPSGAPDTDLVRPLTEIGRVLLPLFFAVSGIAVNLTRARVADLAALALLLAVAVVGKIGGGHLGARLGGLDARTSWTVGVLLDTRGLTELIALNAGLQAHLIDQHLYSVLVVVAVATTAATAPLLTALTRPRPPSPGPVQTRRLRVSTGKTGSLPAHISTSIRPTST
jgi:Kef-type K+ transport system membrane component KefB